MIALIFDRFNPTLVRLRPAGQIALAVLLGMSFNPTLVRLRLSPRGPTRFPSSSFNPTLVRLRRGIPQRSTGSIRAVSIPRWFD